MHCVRAWCILNVKLGCKSRTNVQTDILGSSQLSSPEFHERIDTTVKSLTSGTSCGCLATDPHKEIVQHMTSQKTLYYVCVLCSSVGAGDTREAAIY